MSETIRWLHLTDLHVGIADQDWLWPGMRGRFRDDLQRIHDRAGPWDLVLFTGDLAQGGTQYKRLDEILGEIWTWFRKLGCDPKLLAVPGNHDLKRPNAKKSAVKMLEQWTSDPDVPEDFWASLQGEYRKVVNTAFAGYGKWWQETELRPADIRSGVLPGDFSWTFEKNGVRLGIVGLNTAFLQLTDKQDYEGRLVVHPRQFHGVCDGDGPAWAKSHHACLLMTHHPPEWLSQESRELFHGEIQENFCLHLCGHNHLTQVEQILTGGTGDAPLLWLGRSLFGLERIDKDKLDREHGYAAGELQVTDGGSCLQFMPRWRVQRGRTWDLVPDQKVKLLVDNERTRTFPIRLNPGGGRFPAGPAPHPRTRGSDAQEESPAIPEWNPGRLRALFERWTNDLAAQISAGHQDAGSEGSARYVELFVQDQRSTGAQSAPRPLADLVADPGPRSIIYGPDESGKSTALLKQAADLTRRAETEPEAPVPLFARLNLFDRTEHGLERLLEIVGHAAERSADDMKRLWRGGKRSLLFLLDGYSEVPPDCQQACARALEELAQVARHGIVITACPTVSLDFLLQYGFTAVDILPLTDEQIQGFLDRHKVRGLYDNFTNPLKELARNPFMLSAIAQSCVGAGTAELPRNIGELYKNFIERHLFEQREARKLPAPTRFHYERVKKPILAALALEMCRAGLTSLPENVGTLRTIRDELKRIRSEYEGLLEVKPHVFMPESATPSEFLDEVVTNGVMRRRGGTLEFTPHSVRDYFAAVALLTRTPESLLAEVPVASWVRHKSHPFLTNERRSHLYGAIVMCAGLTAESDALVTGLAPRDPLLAAECLAAGTVSAGAAAAFRETCLALLRDARDDLRFLGCACVRTCRMGADKIIEQLEKILFCEEENEDTRQEAIRALGETSSNTLVPTLLRLIGATPMGTLAFAAVLAITRRIYGYPDYPLALGLLMWHFFGSGSGAPEQNQGRQRREKMYSLYLAGHTPEKLVDLALNPSAGSPVEAFTLLRLLHRPAGVKRFVEVIRERPQAHNLALLFAPQIDANDEVASVLRQVLEDRESPFAVKLNAAAGLACLALQQDHPLSSSGYARMHISWSVGRFLAQRALDRKLPAHDRVAAAVGLAHGAEHSWLGRLLDRLRDPAEDIGFRLLACCTNPVDLLMPRAHWVQIYEWDDTGDRRQEFAEALLERALEDEDDFLRGVAMATIAKSSPDLQEWALGKILGKAGDQETLLSSRRAAIAALGIFPTDKARAKLVELIRDAAQPPELITAAIWSLANSPDAENALKELDALVIAAPHCAALRSGRVPCLAALNRKEEALQDALSAVDLSPNDAQLHVHLARIRRLMGQSREAMSSYRRAVELDESCAEAYAGLAEAAYQLGDVREACEVARSAAKLGMYPFGLFLNLGWYAYENGEFEESIAASQHAAELDPIGATALFNLGIALIAAGRTAEAAKSYEVGIDRCFAFLTNASSIPGALSDLDKLVSSRPELGSVVEDIDKRLRDCERRLKE